MNAFSSTPDKFDVRGLAQAVALNTSADGLNFSLLPAQWDLLAAYLLPCTLAPGQVLITRGEEDRSVYLVESGSMSVHFEDEKSRIRMALVGAGSVAGEGGFFSHLPRSATVQAAGPCVLWCLTPVRFVELSNRQPAIALTLVLAMAAVLAKRLRNRPRSVAAT
jgi:CRP-like cAMP-binding protein